MATNTLTLTNIAEKLNAQWERLQSMKMLADMAFDSLPNSTDEDAPRALLTGMGEILNADLGTLYKLYEDVAAMALKASADVCAIGGGVSHG